MNRSIYPVNRRGQPSPDNKIACYHVYCERDRTWLKPDGTWGDHLVEAAGVKSWDAGFDAICEFGADPDDYFVFASEIGIEPHLMIDVKPFDWRATKQSRSK